ncbi:LysR family transcriptional regulator [uncultured Salinisphaera sp.]|uniref:LysR family transcriptional regulator n=1 Tax=uncultured Salinisphaera sp. TaxID=359372 RepID=UPI0032B2E205
MKRNALDLNALRLLQTVTETGSFTAAAQRSQRSVSAVSREIAAFERALGQRLFYRHTRAVSLTEAGRLYLDAVRPLVEQIDTATETLFSDEAEPAGVLSVNAPVAFGQRQLMALVGSFQARYRQIRVDLRLSDRFEDPVRRAHDVTFRVGQPADSALIARPLAPMRYIVAGAPSYLSQHAAPQTPTDLLAHACLRYQGDYGRQQWYWRSHADAAYTPLTVDGPLYSDDAVSLREAALAGSGLVLFPSWLIDRELAAGTLVPLLEDWQWEVTPQQRLIYMLYAERELAPPKTRAFVNHVLEQIGDPPLWDRWRSATR